MAVRVDPCVDPDIGTVFIYRVVANAVEIDACVMVAFSVTELTLATAATKVDGVMRK